MPEKSQRSVGEFDGKVVVVTGGGRGIGLAIASRFAAAGASVLIADINGRSADDAAAQIRAQHGRAIGVGADVGIATEVDAVFDRCLEEFGTVDVLVNNAAETGPDRLMPFLNADGDWFDHFIRTNLKSQYLCIDRASRIMAAKGDGGCIINVSSGGATRSHRGSVAYDASKGGVEALTRACALELAQYGIRVNTLVPGLIATDPQEAEDAQMLRNATVPLGRGGTAEDLAGPALFLASADAAYVTGTRLVVDGGVLVQQRSPQVEPARLDYPKFA